MEACMRALVLSVALLVVFAGSARAEIRVIDPLTGAWSTVVADRGADLVRWTDDGTGLLIRGDGRAIARVGLDGTRTAQPQIDGAVTVSVGPGGRTVTVGAEEGRDGEYALRAPDGRVVSVQRGPAFSFTPWVSWSADGARVAAVVPDRTVVLDTATGVVLVSQDRKLWMSEQAFAADGSAIVGNDGGRVLRIEIPSGRTTVIGRARETQAAPQIALSSTGRIAVTPLGAVHVLNGPTVGLTGDPGRPALWSPDGQLLSVGFLTADADGCNPYELNGLAAGTPGQPLRVLLTPAERELGTALWSPDGTRLAVEVGREWPPAKRGPRHRWPTRIRPTFGLPTAKANTAARLIVVRASRSLRRGATREAVMNRVRRDYTALEKRHHTARRAAVRRAVAAELDRWLTAAGYEPTEGFIEITC
jgi:hypothetical protein